MVVDDIIDVIKDRFVKHDLYLMHDYTLSRYRYTVIRHNNSIYGYDSYGVIVFHDGHLHYDIGAYQRNANYTSVCINYTDFDIDVLVGLFLCEAYYDGVCYYD